MYWHLIAAQAFASIFSTNKTSPVELELKKWLLVAREVRDTDKIQRADSKYYA